MKPRFAPCLLPLMLALLLVFGGCATTPPAVNAPVATASSIARDRALEDRILAIDPLHVSARDVATLAAGPTPRVMLLHGGVYPVHLVMESFGGFLVGMGYPEAKIRDPATTDWSYSPYDDTRRLAGVVAWNYEHDGMRPMLVGHSQGGLYVVKILKELAGQFSESIAVWNPFNAAAEARTTIVDPQTGRERPVVGLSVAYASALGAGGWALVLPHQWENLTNLRRIPDTVDDFTGYFIEVDFFAWSFPGNPLDSRYEATGTAHVRNVVLPAVYNHVMLPNTQELAQDPQVKDWINAYVPDNGADPSALPGDAPSRALWAADVWYSIKKHWVLEAQRLIRARQETK
jgi:hypothetical protein